jgi:hypothetical protein
VRPSAAQTSNPSPASCKKPPLSRSVGVPPTKHPLSVPTLPRSGSRNGFRSLLSGHRKPPSNFFQNSATFQSAVSSPLRVPAPLREIPFLFPIRGDLPSFAGPKTHKTLPPAIERLPPTGSSRIGQNHGQQNHFKGSPFKERGRPAHKAPSRAPILARSGSRNGFRWLLGEPCQTALEFFSKFRHFPLSAIRAPVRVLLPVRRRVRA